MAVQQDSRVALELRDDPFFVRPQDDVAEELGEQVSRSGSRLKVPLRSLNYFLTSAGRTRMAACTFGSPLSSARTH